MDRRGLREPMLYHQKGTSQTENAFMKCSCELSLFNKFVQVRTAEICITDLVVDVDSLALFHLFRWISFIESQVNLRELNELNTRVNVIKRLKRDDPSDPLLCENTFPFEMDTPGEIVDIEQPIPIIIDHFCFHKVRIIWSAVFSNMHIENVYSDKQDLLRFFYKKARRLFLVDVSKAQINLGLMTARGVSDLEWNSVFLTKASHIPKMLFNDIKRSFLLDVFLTLGQAKIIFNPVQVLREVMSSVRYLYDSLGAIKPIKKARDSAMSALSLSTEGFDMTSRIVGISQVIFIRAGIALVLIHLAVLDSIFGFLMIVGNLATRFAARELPDCSQTSARSVHQAFVEGVRFGIPFNWYCAVRRSAADARRLYYSGVTLRQTVAFLLLPMRLFVGFFAGMNHFLLKIYQGYIVICHSIIKFLHPAMREVLDPPPKIRNPNHFHAFCLQSHDASTARGYEVIRHAVPYIGSETWSCVPVQNAGTTWQRNRCFGNEVSAMTNLTFWWVDKVGLFLIRQNHLEWKCPFSTVVRAFIKADAPKVLVFEGYNGNSEILERNELRLDDEESTLQIFTKAAEFIHYYLKKQSWRSMDYTTHSAHRGGS